MSAAERTPLFGRTREIARLLSSLARGERLITITGPSGMGKTRLALRVARDAAEGFDAVHLVRLASARIALDVQAAVAEALGIAQRQGAELAAAIADQGRLLLVLDNLEHLVPEIRPLLDAWLDRAPGLQILATSIVPLGVEGEVRFELGPLPVEDAIALYRDRASRAAADRDLGDSELEALRELVVRLDRLPLAIELAAARVRVLPPRQLLARIDDRFALLETGQKGRHGSLWEAISLSWELLSDRERQALAYASVFEGGFGLEAAEAVIGPVVGGSALDLVDELRARALLQADDEEGGRFSLYESVRAFAARQLEGMGLLDDALLRHARYHVERAERESKRCHGPEAPQAIRWLLAERENLVAVQRRLADDQPELASRAGVALAEVLALSGPPSREEEILTASIRLARRARNPGLEGEALFRRARAYKRLGRHTEALDDIRQGLELARAQGDRFLEGRLLLESGAVRSLLGETATALADLDAAETIGRAEGIREFQGIAWLIRGVVEEYRGRAEEAASAFLRSLEIFREVGHLRYQGVALLNIGAVHSHLGRFADARHYLVESRRIFRLLENPAAEVNVLLNLGGVALAEGAHAQATHWFKKALEVERKLANPKVRGIALAQLALVALEDDSPGRAATLLEQALAALRPLPERRTIILYLPFHAFCLARQRRFGEARQAIAEARAEFERIDDRASLHTVALLESAIELEEARLAGDRARVQATAERLRTALATPVEGRSMDGVFIARRLAQRSLGRLGSGAVLRVGPEASWFEWEGVQVDLRRRGAVRRIFRALVENRLHSPGTGMTAETLVEVGWPGERILPEAAASRVYSGIRTLRALGLEKVLLRHAEGYLLDPEVDVVLA